MTTEIYFGNKIIAQFMEVEFNKEGDKCNHPLVFAPWPPIECLKYHTSWDWLMLVVRKINYAGTPYNARKWNLIKDGLCHQELTDTFNAVVDFVKWCNENPNVHNINQLPYDSI